MKKLGLIINPIAGMGGSVGLKGTDGVIEEAVLRGARKSAELRAKEALTKLISAKDDVLVLCPSGEMGENLAKSLGFCVEVVYFAKDLTDSEDTVSALKEMKDVDLLLFTGGDGIARDVVKSGYSGLSIGIPAGVKIHSPVYSVRPELGGELALKVLKGTRNRVKAEEVLDIDEDAYREGRVVTKLYGYLKVPDDTDFMQHGKASTPETEYEEQMSIAVEMVKRMKKDALYLVGPGTTTKALMDELKIPNTLLGVDLVRNGELIRSDLSEKEILAEIRGKETYLVITPTGGQGFLLGRGNQQISPDVIKEVGKDNIFILATKEKLFNMEGRPLLVDTGDREVDDMLSGYRRVIIGFMEEQMVRIGKE